MLVVCCAQAVWYDEGTDLYDTRSGFAIKDDFWNQCLEANEAAHLIRLPSMREATSAQADITSIAASKPDWFRGSTKWDDAAALSGELA